VIHEIVDKSESEKYFTVKENVTLKEAYANISTEYVTVSIKIYRSISYDKFHVNFINLDKL